MVYIKLVTFLLSVSLIYASPADWATNAPPPSTGEVTAITVRVTIDGDVKSSGEVAAFLDSGVQACYQSTASFIPNIPTFGTFKNSHVWACPLHTVAGAITDGGKVRFHYSPDGAADIELDPEYTFITGDTAYYDLTGTAATSSDQEGAEGDSAPADVNCQETETIGDCSNGVQSVTYTDQEQPTGNGQACSTDTTQSCTGADGASCSQSDHCDNSCFQSVCRTPVNCVETETVGNCINGEQTTTYDVSASAAYGGTPCSTGETVPCTGADGASCSQSDDCDNSCFQSVCRTPVNCVETETVGNCINGEQTTTYSFDTLAAYGGTPCSTDTTQTCTGDVGASCTLNDHCTEGNCDDSSNLCAELASTIELISTGVGWDTDTAHLIGTAAGCEAIMSEAKAEVRKLTGYENYEFRTGYETTLLQADLALDNYPKGCIIRISNSDANGVHTNNVMYFNTPPNGVGSNPETYKRAVVTIAAPPSVDCQETETIGTCSNGVQSVTYTDQEQPTGNGQACSTDTTQPCGDCVGQWGALGACINGYKNKNYEVTTVKTGEGTNDCQYAHGEAHPMPESCEGSHGDACTSWDQCLDEICVDFTCRADCQVDANAVVTNEPCYCQSDAAMKTSDQDTCAIPCSLNRDDSVRSSPCNCVDEGAIKTSDEDTCTGASYFEGETPDGSACSSKSDCVSDSCYGGTCGGDPADDYENTGGNIAPSTAPGTHLSKAQCARYASMLGVEMGEAVDPAEGCTSDGSDVNFNDGSNPAYAGANSAGCGNAGFGCITCKDGATCGVGVVTGGGSDAGTIQLTTDADVDLLTLKLCDDTAASIAEIDDTGGSYTMVHSLGLTYQRDNLDAEREPVTYCQDQEFVTSIARDASATTSVTTLISPALQRSIIVHGINWYKCPSTLLACQGSDECYQLKIDLSTREKNAEATSWSNASLSDSFQHQGGANTDNFDVVHSLSAATPGNIVQLVGQCGIIPNCSLSDPGIVNHWNDHTATDQDIVLRGTFEGSNVDSIASIETAFMECPLGATTDYNGVLKLGLHLTCEDREGNDAALQTIDSDITDENGIVQNCRSALTSSIVRVTTDVFVDTKDPTGKAAADGWEMKDVDFKFNRYEATVDGQKSKLISSDLMMQMRYHDEASGWTCTRLKEKIQSLPVFDRQIMDCDITDLTTTAFSTTKSGLTHGEAGTIMFNLEPIREHSNDAYEVEVIAMLQNTELEQTRRLRTKYKLKSGGLANEETAFPLLNAADEDHDHHDHESLVGLLIAVVVLLAIIASGLFMCCRSKGMAVQLATVEEKQGLISERPVRRGLRNRFKNLRY